jgi:hypothetical protein
MSKITEKQVCIPQPLNPNGFNPHAEIPYGVKPEHIRSAMEDFLDFIGFIDQQLNTKGLSRFEKMLMPANFSSIVGEFMSGTIPKYAPSIVKNKYHNGHPDLIPAGVYVGDSALHVDKGIEIKASRYLRGWQGHNPEEIWLMVFVFDSNRPQDTDLKPFKFIKVVGAQLTKDDWLFSGRSATSRRTITASVTESGYQKMMANWIYKETP